MTLLQSFILGLVQGIAEFLPISSSGHLAVLEGFYHIEVTKLFDVLLHIGTLLATFIIFRERIASIFVNIFKSFQKGYKMDIVTYHIFLGVLLATFLTALIGVTIDKFFPDFTIRQVGVFFIATALILSLTIIKSRLSLGYESKNFLYIALIVGFAQGIAVLPGISRSGITITIALLLGMKRKEAGEFSFFLSIPAVLGAAILESRDIGSLTSVVDNTTLLVGVFTAFISGIVSLYFLLRIVQSGRLWVFVPYLVIVGFFTIFC